jgi:hypothetical protein
MYIFEALTAVPVGLVTGARQTKCTNDDHLVCVGFDLALLRVLAF